MDEKEDDTFQSDEDTLEKSESQSDSKSDEIFPADEEQTPPIEEEVSGVKEPVPETKKEVPQKDPQTEVEKKQPSEIAKKIKRTVLAVILIIALILVGGIYAWTSGIEDLRDDSTYLIVVVYKDVPKAASIYHTETKESEIIEVTELGALTNRKRYFNNAQKEFGLLDRMIIIDVDTLRLLSTDDYIVYENGEKIYVDEMYDWIIGSKYPRVEIIGDDTPSLVNAKVLKAWIDHYSDKLLGGYGGYTAKVVLNAYRAGKIEIYPGNSALTILKYVAVERIFFPVD